MTEGIHAAREQDSAYVADARYFPLLVVTWFGTMSEALVPKYFEWQVPILRRVIAEKTKFTFVVDCTRCARPTPKVRKLVVDLSNAGPREADAYALPTYTAIESALVRGAITAMQWVVSVDWRIVTVPTARHGLHKALAALAAAGVPAPAGLDADAWIPPDMPASSSDAATG